ncbi:MULTISPECIES: phosphoglycerate dehydrogenase [Aerococcus]|uniref:Glyoxylate reductase n=1 Tax=Aerococcus viridans TaxID=1377 RepID=A0A2N6UCT9_9LACT|nr:MULTISPECIES: phosphoglycerate dehydrogenase [Aerococcus]OFU51496.1 glyoxylate reductase [Aerococcus sp. HMSC10H05]PMC79388.1 glyoxylate reductase [Aerococcus viridans]
MQKIIAIANLVKDWQFKDIQDIASNYQVKRADELTDVDYPNIEIQYGWNADLAEKYKMNGYDSLRWIQVQFAGINQLPKEIVTDQNIQITNMSGIHATPIAETVFGYILNYYRSLHIYKAREQEKHWAYAKHMSLPEKKMLIFGAGNVGKEIARIGQAFGLETVGVNTSGRNVDHFDQTVKTADGFKQVTDANIIVNVLPETDATQAVFNTDFFNRQENQPLFINVGRGSAVVDEDLINALENDRIAYAALDVFNEEPLPRDHPFWTHEKIDVTPHMTGQVEHFAIETYKIFHANLKAYAEKGDLAVNVVSKEKGY